MVPLRSEASLSAFCACKIMVQVIKKLWKTIQKLEGKKKKAHPPTFSTIPKRTALRKMIELFPLQQILNTNDIQ
jgi:hypothetical protein